MPTTRNQSKSRQKSQKSKIKQNHQSGQTSENVQQKKESNMDLRSRKTKIDCKEAPVQKNINKKLKNTKEKPMSPYLLKKKSMEQTRRIQRSKQQKIYLIAATRQIEEWSFTVEGTKGRNYHVTVSTTIKCTCMDFRLKRKPCKHIYFIVTQVGQNQELLEYFTDSLKITEKAFKSLDKQLFKRLKSRLQKTETNQKQIDLKDDTTCVICFCEMEKETEHLQECGTCKKYFHSECISAWKSHNPTCPLCRGQLAHEEKDPLQKLKQIDI